MKYKIINAPKVLWLFLAPISAFLAFLLTYELVDIALGRFLDNSNLFKVFIPVVIAIYIFLKVFILITGIGFAKKKKERKSITLH